MNETARKEKLKKDGSYGDITNGGVIKSISKVRDREDDKSLGNVRIEVIWYKGQYTRGEYIINIVAWIIILIFIRVGKWAKLRKYLVKVAIAKITIN